MNCYYHSEATALTQCKKCQKHLCGECHDSEYPGYCYSCSLDFRNGTQLHDKDQHLAARRNAQNMDTARKIIGWYEIAGGVAGILLIASIARRIGIFQHTTVALIFGIFFILYLISMWAGFMLLRRMKGAETVSIAIQAVQIPQFIIQGIGYSFMAGAKFVLMFYTGMGTGTRVDFGVFSQFNLNINLGMPGFLAAVNLVPIVVIYFLVQMRSATGRGSASNGIEEISG